MIKARGRDLKANVATSSNEVRIAFADPLILLAGEEITVAFDLQHAR